jgi:uncharacterized protein
MPSDQEAIAAWLARPDSYPHRPDRVELVETHISQVFLAGSYVYKLKKPVKYDFLDFSTLEAREHACREEVRLNRRLAPDTYLRVVPITRRLDGAFSWDGTGAIVDWVVEMRRLPTELTLDSLQARGNLHSEHLDRLTAALVSFYRSLPPASLSPWEYRERYLAHVRDNARELMAVTHHLPRGSVERAIGFQLQLLNLHPELLEGRVRAGRIVDGHGDLRPEHICFSDPIAIFDCIEFSADLRRIDVADEIAFLAAECEFLGANWVGPRLMADFQERMDDHPPAVLTDFYKAYRACVRAKVAALRADQIEGPRHEASMAEATKHLGLADSYAASWLRPLMIVVGGLAGTGKTTLATAIAEHFGAELLRTDVIRQELFAGSSDAGTSASGVYSAASLQRVYEEMFKRGAALHAERISMVLDGTFSDVATLERAQKLATDPMSIFLAVECECRPEIAHRRISQRLAEGRDASQATPKVHDIQRIQRKSWPSSVHQIRIDTEQPIGRQIGHALAALKRLVC